VETCYRHYAHFSYNYANSGHGHVRKRNISGHDQPGLVTEQEAEEKSTLAHQIRDDVEQ
jgi:hypothetical protein